MKFPHSCACAPSLVFEKKVFLKSTIFFLKKQPHSDKCYHIFCKHVKGKGNIVQKTFLDFADVSSYLRTKLSAGKRGCTLCFALQMPQTPSTLILESSYKALPMIVKIETL